MSQIYRVQWPTLIRELEAVGITPHKLGEMLGRHKETIEYWRDTPTAEPKHYDGCRVIAIHEEYCQKNFAQASTVPAT